MVLPRNIVLACLAGVAVSLLLVGVESSTPIRHLVQIVPIALAIPFAARRPAWGALVAIPIFMFWALIMIFIWLYLLGLSRAASGQYTAIEIALTVVIVAFAAAGIATSVRLVEAPTWSHRAVVLFVFAAAGGLQALAMRVSFLPPFALR